MKKRLAFSLLVVLSFLLLAVASCSGGQAPGAADATADRNDTTPDNAPAPDPPVITGVEPASIDLDSAQKDSVEIAGKGFVNTLGSVDKVTLGLVSVDNEVQVDAPIQDVEPDRITVRTENVSRSGDYTVYIRNSAARQWSRMEDALKVAAQEPQQTDVEPQLHEAAAASQAQTRAIAELSRGTTFVPVAVENPGGGRIRDKTEPSASELATIQGYGGQTLRIHYLAKQALEALIRDARAAGYASPLFLPVSAYRSVEEQWEIWNRERPKYSSDEECRKWVAYPGNSAHQTGRAVDLYLGDGSSAYQWLKKNAVRYGFYPYENEAWHWEYNPPA